MVLKAFRISSSDQHCFIDFGTSSQLMSGPERAQPNQNVKSHARMSCHKELPQPGTSQENKKPLPVLLEGRGLHAAGGKREKVIMAGMTSEFPGVSVGRAKLHQVPALGVTQSLKE